MGVGHISSVSKVLLKYGSTGNMYAQIWLIESQKIHIPSSFHAWDFSKVSLEHEKPNMFSLRSSETPCSSSGVMNTN